MFLVWLSPNSHQTRAIWYIKIWIPPETNVSMQGRHYCVIIRPKLTCREANLLVTRFFKGWKKLIQNSFTARESKLWIQIQNVLDLICRYQHGAGRNCKCLIFNTYPILYPSWALDRPGLAEVSSSVHKRSTYEAFNWTHSGFHERPGLRLRSNRGCMKE